MTRNAYDCYEVSTSTGSTGRQDGQAEGERRKNAAHVLLMARRAALVRQAQRALLLAALDRGESTADDVAAAVDVPPTVDARLLGAAPGALVRAGLIRLAGYVRSNRPERHASVIAVWRLADRLAALRWLADNPPLPEPLDDLDADDLDANAGRRQARLAFWDDEEPATGTAAAGSL
jgi:hypothetical protein